LITVFGATGAQGGSVITYLLNSNKYRLRGVTRNVNDQKAKDLSARGVEMVEANMATDSVEKLASVMKDSYGAYLLTNFWDPSSMNKEEVQGKQLVDAAKQAGVRHVMWSTLSNVQKVSGSKGVPHFTDKAIVEDYIRSLQTSSKPPFQHVTFVAPAFYYQNFQSFFPPKLEGDTVVFTLPDTKTLTAYDVNDTGIAVLSAFENPKEYELKRIDFYGSHMAPQQYIDEFAKVTGRKTKLILIPRDVFATFPFATAHEIADMFTWFNDHTYFGPEGNRELGNKACQNKLATWEQYLQKSKWNGPSA
jgi:uncharacterized protein YbjT (DUF2867 family)